MRRSLRLETMPMLFTIVSPALGTQIQAVYKMFGELLNEGGQGRA